MRADPSVHVFGEDIDKSVLGPTQGLVGEFRVSRIRNTPISEQAVLGSLIGASLTGLRPVILADDRRWLLGARETLSPDRRRDLDELFGEGSAAYGSGIGAMVVALPEARTARQFVAALAVTDTRTIVREMLGEVIRDPEAGAQLERILDGAADEIEAFAARTGEYHCAAAETLLAAPGAAIDRIRGLLAEWLARYEEVEPRVQQIITRDIALRQADRALPAVELVERTTGGVRWLGEAGVSRVVLSPSYFARPVNYIFSGLDWRLFAYPVADEALDATDASAPPSPWSASTGRSARVAPAHPAPAARPRHVSDRAGAGARGKQADHEAPPDRAPRGGSGDRHRPRCPDLLQPSQGPTLGSRGRPDALPRLSHAAPRPRSLATTASRGTEC